MNQLTEHDERLTVRQACAELRCSRWTLDRLFAAGKLTKVTKGRNVYVDPAELRAYIRRNGTVRPAQPAGVALSADDVAALKALAQIVGPYLADASKQQAA